jgi:hypothetical protein
MASHSSTPGDWRALRRGWWNEAVRREIEGVLARKLEEHPLNLIDVGEINDDLLDALMELGSVR